MVYNERNKGEQSLHYRSEQWNKKRIFDIINNISENVTLVQMIDSLGNVNHAVSVVRKWILIPTTKKIYYCKLYH